jgi:hypothetical protein
MATYNPIPFGDLAAFLVERGFQDRVVNKEVVFEQANKRNERLVVCVYTSCTPQGVTRGKGKDAIRVCLVADSDKAGRVGVAKSKRVYRVGTTESILTRVLDRARDMYRLSNQIIKSPRCKCGAPTYPTSKRCILNNRCPLKK